jgi:hypothetical protein
MDKYRIDLTKKEHENILISLSLNNLKDSKFFEKVVNAKKIHSSPKKILHGKSLSSTRWKGFEKKVLAELKCMKDLGEEISPTSVSRKLDIAYNTAIKYIALAKKG